MNANCEDLIPLLVRAAEHALADPERAILEAHLSVCPDCTASLEDQMALKAALARLADDAPSTFVGSRVIATLRAEEREAGRATWIDLLDWRRWTWRLVPVAAVLAVAVATVSRSNGVAVETASTTSTSQTLASSALYTQDVSGSDLLSLLLNAHADQAVTMQGGPQ